MNLSKKNKIIAIIIIFLVLGGTGGYLLWRVNQENTVAPTDSDASSCHPKCDPGACQAQSNSTCSDEKHAGCGSGMGDPGVGKSWCCTYTLVCTHSCGDKTCDEDETVTSCPKDCAKCGDNICSSTESLESCPEDCSVCGDNKCTGSETLATCPEDCGTCGDSICGSNENSTNCASDCACKAMVWTNKPSGEYRPTVKTLSPITIINPNSTSITTTGIDIKLNSIALTQCGTLAGSSCFEITKSPTNQQLVMLSLFGGQPTIAEGEYSLSVALPGASEVCLESASFKVAADAVVVVPQTGLFDGTLGKIYMGFGFMFLGVVTTQIPKFSLMFNTIGEKNRVVLEEQKVRNEEKKRNRFEKRFK